MRSLPTATLLAATAALTLSACGTTEPEVANTGASGGAGITVTDSRGAAITLDGPATRVVGLEWGVIEHLVALGVMPVGAADLEGYANWVSAEPLDESVTDVGVRGEPSIEAIAALSPDLVVAAAGLPEGAIAQLEEFVPVIVVPGGDAANPIGQMIKNVELIATATGSENAADQLMADFDAKLTDGAAALDAAGLAGRSFAFMDAYLDGSQVLIRPFAEGALVTAVTQELGLINAWPGDGDPEYGLDDTDVEGLTVLGEGVNFLYYANDNDGGDAFTEGLSDNAVWQSLPFVQSGNVHRLPDGIWMFGGPSSMAQYIDAVVDTLTT